MSVSPESKTSASSSPQPFFFFLELQTCRLCDHFSNQQKNNIPQTRHLNGHCAGMAVDRLQKCRCVNSLKWCGVAKGRYNVGNLCVKSEHASPQKHLVERNLNRKAWRLIIVLSIALLISYILSGCEKHSGA